MRLDTAKSPSPGDVPEAEKSVFMGSMTSATDPMTGNTSNYYSDYKSNSCFQEAQQQQPQQPHWSKTFNLSGSTTMTTSNPTISTRTHVMRSTGRILQHRCCNSNCCRETRTSSKYSRITSFHHRHSVNSQNFQPNIPFNIPETAALTSHESRLTSEDHNTRVLTPAPEQGHGATIENRLSPSLDNRETNRWQSNIPHNYNINLNNSNHDGISNKGLMVSRGFGNPLVSSSPNHQYLLQQQIPQQQLQQQQPQQQQSRVHPYYRKKAINCMMTHLRLRVNENNEALEAVRRRIERLEDQVFTSASSKDQYVDLLASKLGAIMERLYSCRNSRTNGRQLHTQSHQQALSQSHQQSACV